MANAVTHQQGFITALKKNCLPWRTHEENFLYQAGDSACKATCVYTNRIPTWTTLELCTSAQPLEEFFVTSLSAGLGNTRRNYRVVTQRQTSCGGGCAIVCRSLSLTGGLLLGMGAMICFCMGAVRVRVVETPGGSIRVTGYRPLDCTCSAPLVSANSRCSAR